MLLSQKIKNSGLKFVLCIISSAGLYLGLYFVLDRTFYSDYIDTDYYLFPLLFLAVFAIASFIRVESLKTDKKQINSKTNYTKYFLILMTVIGVFYSGQFIWEDLLYPGYMGVEYYMFSILFVISLIASCLVKVKP